MRERQFLKVFFVCPGMDENDNIPSWTVDCFPEEIGLKPLPKEYPESKGHGFVTLRKSDLDATFMPIEQSLADGD